MKRERERGEEADQNLCLDAIGVNKHGQTGRQASEGEGKVKVCEGEGANKRKTSKQLVNMKEI